MFTLVAKLFDRTITFPLTEDLSEVSSGSLPEHRIYLPYRGVSRHHFTLIRKEDGWMLRDEGSTNGTLLNGEKVRNATIKAGDVIQAGMIKIQVEEGDAAPTLFPQKSLNERLTGTDRLSNELLEPASEVYSFPKFVLPKGFILGKSPSIISVYQKLHSLVDSDLNILLIGETGTGKEMFARMLHLSGKRANLPFVAVNCAAIPSDLLETELFGIGEKVATGVSKREGKFVAAHGGTLFLDELEAFPVPLQSKILRAIEEKACTPVGEAKALPADFRLLSATNQDPRELLRTNLLRQDLYHRLATVELRLPPLRERKEDIHDLIMEMLPRIAGDENKVFAGVSKRLMDLLLNYSYPGNLRELNNILRAMVALGHNWEMLDIHLVPQNLLGPGSDGKPHDPAQHYLSKDSFDLRGVVDTLTKQIVVGVLAQCEGNVRKASERMGLTEFGLRKMMKRLEIPFRRKP